MLLIFSVNGCPIKEMHISPLSQSWQTLHYTKPYFWDNITAPVTGNTQWLNSEHFDHSYCKIMMASDRLFSCEGTDKHSARNNSSRGGCQWSLLSRFQMHSFLLWHAISYSISIFSIFFYQSLKNEKKRINTAIERMQERTIIIISGV